MVRSVSVFLFCTTMLLAQWPQFRGPNGSGVGESSARLPVRFGPAAGVAWKTQLPSGHSSPVIWGDRIFLTAAEPGQRKSVALGKIIDVGGKLYTICLDRPTGKILWKREAPRPRVEPY